MAELETGVGVWRRKRGVPAAQLAMQVGVSRQTIYSIEAGTFVPNTAVALRLARALDATVEELFTLPEDVTRAMPRPAAASLLPGSGSLAAGQAVQLCRVGQRLVAAPPSPVNWCFPPVDGILAGPARAHRQARVQAFEENDFSGRILIAGCDPGISVLSRRLQAAKVDTVLVHRNSSQALALLKSGDIHIAGTHLPDEGNSGSHLQAIGRLFPDKSAAVVTFAIWEEGLVFATPNPKQIGGVADLARTDVSIVNREKGSGSRALLDAHLKKAALQADQVRGYETCAHGHLQAVWQVRTGAADCCVATRAAASFFGLGFLPLASERYNLVLRKQHLALPRIQSLFDLLSRADLRRELDCLGGYDTRVSGERVL